MDQCFDFAVGLHSHKRMVGTRKVLREEEEVQPNGKVFLKWDMGDYSWKSYAEVITKMITFLSLKFILFQLSQSSEEFSLI